MDVSLQYIVKMIQASAKIVLTTHINPDGDALGSMLALYHHLTSRNKCVTMLLDDEIPEVYYFLAGCSDVRKPVNTDADLLIVLDASDIERIGEVASCVKAPILNIDHHISNTKFADYYFIDSSAAATGEIIYDLLQLEGANIIPEVANCLFTAIATDCGFFKYANTTSKTMNYAAKLIDNGAQPTLIADAIEVKPLNSIVTLTKALETLEVFHSGKIASLVVSADENGNFENTEGFINYPRNIQGVEVAILFKVVDEEHVRISLRSRKVDVSKLALQFGGGGHIRAAGCTVNGSFMEVKKIIIEASRKLIQEEV